MHQICRYINGNIEASMIFEKKKKKGEKGMYVCMYLFIYVENQY